jgi:hypothetical protein
MKTITLQQVVPGRNSQLNVLVGGVKQFVAAKTQGPGVWFVYPEDSHESIGMAGSKAEIKRLVDEFLQTVL